MRIFDFYGDVDFGYDAYFTLGQFNNFNLIDAEIHISDYWSWNPRMRLTLGFLCGKVFSVDFSIWSFSFSIDLISYEAPYNLAHTREL